MTDRARLFGQERLLVSTPLSLLTKVWAPSRCKFFLWPLVQDQVWTAARLQQHQWPNQYFCPLCRHNLETSAHLFTECTFSRSVWAAVSAWLDEPRLHPPSWMCTDHIADWFVALLDDSKATKSKGIRSLIILTCWTIWKERNMRVF
jgi:hypothetical protein